MARRTKGTLPSKPPSVAELESIVSNNTSQRGSIDSLDINHVRVVPSDDGEIKVDTLDAQHVRSIEYRDSIQYKDARARRAGTYALIVCGVGVVATMVLWFPLHLGTAEQFSTVSVFLVGTSGGGVGGFFLGRRSGVGE